MGRRVVPLTLDLLDELAAPCRDCLFWEFDAVRRVGVTPEEVPAEKEAWVSGVLREWGSCGRVILLDDQPVGHVTYAPATFVPGSAGFPTAPISKDAVQMTAIWIRPEARGGGLGRVLIQAMARDLIGRGGIRAVEAFADKGPLSAIHGSRCAAPEQFLARVGFKTHRPHPTAPRMRMDLHSILTWRDVEGAVERLIDVVRPRKVPMPQHREVPGHRGG